jgi:hypothetical protein
LVWSQPWGQEIIVPVGTSAKLEVRPHDASVCGAVFTDETVYVFEGDEFTAYDVAALPSRVYTRRADGWNRQSSNLR